MISKNKILFLVIILFLSCCQNENKINKLLTPPEVKRLDKYFIEITDTLHIKLKCNINLNVAQLFCNNDSLVYILDNFNSPFVLAPQKVGQNYS